MFVTLLTTTLLVLAAVAIHLEALWLLARLLRKFHPRPRTGIAIAFLGALCAHLLEIAVFAVGIYMLDASPGHGELVGARSVIGEDCIYYSMVTYTSLGFGDLTPTGALRFLTGVETLTGLLLIAWTASFMFLQMQRLWNVTHTDNRT